MPLLNYIDKTDMQGNPGASDLVVRTGSHWYMSGTVLKITLDSHVTPRPSVQVVQAWKHIYFDASYACMHLRWSVRESSIWNNDRSEVGQLHDFG